MLCTTDLHEHSSNGRYSKEIVLLLNWGFTWMLVITVSMYRVMTFDYIKGIFQLKRFKSKIDFIRDNYKLYSFNLNWFEVIRDTR